MSASYTEFADKHVVVTGAASGIGKQIARAFAEDGAKVSALDIDDDGLNKLAATCPKAFPIVCDLTQPSAIDEAVSSALSQRGDVSVLVNNAGADRRIAFDATTPALFREMMALNIDHHMQLSRLLAPGMRELGKGAIVNLSSTAWMKNAGNLAAYHAAKAGIVGLTCGLARDLGTDNIRVNAIAPGRVFTERAYETADAAYVEDTRRIQCLPELISARDIADTALWLASDSARMITAQTIVVDGGVL